ncbi:MAG: CDP-glucose 4,6-dehydratase [Bacteroidetes bacterium]|nr:CDP-glucose 4,6-dehydratase [Bacteroidota bacterium]
MVNLADLTSVYKGKKVFVTGHTGFKGSWLVSWLHLLGAEVKGLALTPEYPHSLYSFLESQKIVDSVINDIRNRKALTTEIEKFKPDFIFHLAAQPLVRRSYTIPSETFDVNVTGTSNVLEAVIKLNKKCTVVAITTDKVYHNKEQNVLYNEDDALGGYDPYSASKACAELVINSFRNSFFNIPHYETHQKALASARAGNVIGGGDFSEDRIIPDIIRALQNDKVIDVRNPASVRPWQHVLEPIGGYLLLGALLEKSPIQFSKAYNFGPKPNDHLTVKDLVQTAIKIWGSGSWKDSSTPNQHHEATLLKLDISRAVKELNWSPKLDAETAIEWTINWYRQSPESKMKFTFDQINQYIKR